SPESPLTAMTDMSPRIVIPPTRPGPRGAKSRPPGGKRVWLWPAVACGAVVLVLLLAWATGQFKVKTKDGTLVLENVPPDAEVVVDGEKVTITRNGETVEIFAVKEGPHTLKVAQGGKEVWAKDVTFKVGGDPV